MDQDLSRSLHHLTARLDREADTFLRRHAGLSYSRFLALYMVGSWGADTQRVLAERLGITEPSVSRMTRVLAEAGWLETIPEPAGGNRKRLMLTEAGQEIVTRWGGELELRFSALVAASGVSYEDFRDETHRLLAQLDDRGVQAGARGEEQPEGGSLR